ncbi:hypothetical protein GQ472_00630 [archaeon]|nr:hypothetical protein [archaeon]
MVFRTDRQRRKVMATLKDVRRRYPIVQVKSADVPDLRVHEGNIGRYTGNKLTGKGIVVGRVSGYDGWGRGEDSEIYSIIDTSYTYPILIGNVHNHDLKNMMYGMAVYQE